MFLDNINTNLFRPLASANARLYGLGLFALHNRLIARQLDTEECTPKEARSVIRRELISANQLVEWNENEMEPVELSDETDDAARIYSYLKQCGWIVEIDDVGYRRVIYIPQIASRLLTALSNLADRRSANLKATSQGVYNSLLQVQSNPKSSASLITFAADSSRAFYDELASVAASSREVSHRMREQKVGPELFRAFFKDFMGDTLANYDNIKINSHPNRYRVNTLKVIVDIQYDPKVMAALVEATIKSAQEDGREMDKEVAKETILKDLNDIYRVFQNIDGLMTRIEHYRSMTARRTREAMQYTYRAIPDIGLRLENIIQKLGQVGDSIDLKINAPLLSDNYVSSNRCYVPRQASVEAMATTITIKAPPVWDIAFDRAYDDYLHRRAENPRRILNFLEDNLKDRSSISTHDIKINNLDELIAFMQLRDLLHDAVAKGSPYAQLLRYYRVSPIPNSIVENEYVIAPALKIERRAPAPKEGMTNVKRVASNSRKSC